MGNSARLLKKNGSRYSTQILFANGQRCTMSFNAPGWDERTWSVRYGKRQFWDFHHQILPLLQFPVEILIRILCNLNSFEELFFAIQTCRRLYSCYLKATEEVVTSIFTRDRLDYTLDNTLDSRHLFILQFAELDFAIRKSFIRSKDARKMLGIIRETYPKYKQLLILLHNRLCLRVEYELSQFDDQEIDEATNEEADEVTDEGADEATNEEADEATNEEVDEATDEEANGVGNDGIDWRWWDTWKYRRWWDIDTDEVTILPPDQTIDDEVFERIYNIPVKEFGDVLIKPTFFTSMLRRNIRRHGRIAGLVRTVIHKVSYRENITLEPMDWILRPTRQGDI